VFGSVEAAGVEFMPRTAARGWGCRRLRDNVGRCELSRRVGPCLSVAAGRNVCCRVLLCSINSTLTAGW